MRERLINAAVALLLGIAFCFVVYWWQFRYEYAAHGLALPLFASIPFIGLAAMIIGGMGRLATSLGFLVLAGLTGVVFITAAQSSSSTAAIAFLIPLVYGTIVNSVIFAVDNILHIRSKPG